MEKKIAVIKAISAVRTRSSRPEASLAESKKTMDFWNGTLNAELQEVLDYLAIHAEKAERADVFEKMAQTHHANYNHLDQIYQELLLRSHKLNELIDELQADVADLKEALRQEQIDGAKVLSSLHQAERRLETMNKFAAAAAKMLTPEQLLWICTETEW